jgi:hypothetical protein
MMTRLWFGSGGLAFFTRNPLLAIKLNNNTQTKIIEHLDSEKLTTPSAQTPPSVLLSMEVIDSLIDWTLDDFDEVVGAVVVFFVVGAVVGFFVVGSIGSWKNEE